MKNTNNTQKANHINGNCKAVRDITNDIKYNSVMEAALANGVRNSTMSVAINRGYVCNGNQFMFEKDLHEQADSLCKQLAKANARVIIAENKLSEMEMLRAKANEYDKLMAEQKAKEEAEAKRLEAERKAKEMHEAKIAKAKEKVARCETIVERYKGKLTMATNHLMAAEIELEELMGEVV